MHFITDLINHYGYIMIFTALFLELIAFPLPGEALMTYCGFLAYESKMNVILAIFSAACGAVLGITAAYFIGLKLGKGFFHKYGHYVHLGPEQLERTSLWFNSYGKRLLILSFFLPGIRHITGYFSGITRISKGKFMLNAYAGAILWTTTFISLGKALGPNWHRVDSFLKKYIVLICLILSLILILIYAYRNHRETIKSSITLKLTQGMTVFHSMGNMKVAVAVTAAAFLGFFLLLIGVVQDYLANEAEQFNEIVKTIMTNLFSNSWEGFFNVFDQVVSIPLIALAFVLMVSWSLYVNSARFLEIRFIFIVLLGAEMLQYVLSRIFARFSPVSQHLGGMESYSFPSSHSLIAISCFGFFAFLLLRHSRKSLRSTAITSVTFLICLSSGLSPLYFQRELANGVYAGYVIGGVWLTMNILLMETYRILPKLQEKS